MLVALLMMATPAHAAMIWTGDPARGTAVFGNMNCDSPGSVTAVTDPAKGRVWRYTKPGSSNRCENHGISVNGKRYVFKGGETYWLGWHSKLTNAANNNATFQWKSYGNHKQNFPVVLKMINGRIHMLHSPLGGSDRLIWSAPVKADEWHHFAIGLFLSPDTNKGWVEIYFDGQQQTFTNNTKRYVARTLDDINEPKWGIYGGRGQNMTNFVADLRVGTTYSDVASR